MHRILVSMYNTDKIGGPTVCSLNLINSFLKEKYSFSTIIINEHLGKFIRLKVIRRLVKEIKSNDPDIILINGLQLHGFYMMLASRLAGYKKKTFVIVHGSACDGIHIGKLTRFVFGKFLEPYTAKKAACLVTVCQKMAENPIIKKNAKHFRGVIHNPIPIVLDDSADEIKTSQSQKSDNIDTTIKLVYTGRIIEDKGIGYLIDAMLTTNNCTLYLIGDGPDLEEYRKRVIDLGLSSRIFFLGRRSNVVRLLKSYDIFVFPSLHENMPNSILEAFMAGLPVVATNVGGIPEMIVDGFNGLLVNPCSSQELSAALSLLVQKKEMRKNMASNAKSYALEHFSHDKIFGMYDHLFEEMINNSK